MTHSEPLEGSTQVKCATAAAAEAARAHEIIAPLGAPSGRRGGGGSGEKRARLICSIWLTGFRVPFSTAAARTRRGAQIWQPHSLSWSTIGGGGGCCSVFVPSV